MQEINYTIQLSAHMYHCLCIEFILHKNGVGVGFKVNLMFQLGLAISFSLLFPIILPNSWMWFSCGHYTYGYNVFNMKESWHCLLT